MIPGINTAGSYVHYQRQIAAKDVTAPFVSEVKSQPEDKNSSSDYKINLSREKNKIEQDYSNKQSTLEQEHKKKIIQLESQYDKQQSQLEQEYSIKKRSLNFSVYV